jgi:predicted Zn-dependent peptidase
MVLLVPGGTAIDGAAQAGLMSMTADLLDEGSHGASALEMSDRIARLGGDLDVEVSHDATTVSFVTLDRYLEDGLALLRDVAVHPNLVDHDFERVRQLRLERLRQLRDLPGALADRAFAQVLYQSHPYAQPGFGTSASIASLSIGDVRSVHGRVFRPAGATLVVAGDRPAEALLDAAERLWSLWHAGDEDVAGVRDRGRLEPPMYPSHALATWHRPGAAQSELRIGQVSVSRATPDYHALLLLNAVLGGQFVSRLNMNLRESKGYTYGVRTGFDLRRGKGPFVMQTSVGTGVTVPALREALEELRAIRETRPVTADELVRAQSSVALGYPRGFETVQQLARGAASLALHDLPDSYFEDFIPTLMRVTLDDVHAVAQRVLDPARWAVVVVGDLEHGGEGLDALGLGPAAPVHLAL